MKKIICLFVLLALASGVHAGDKKKKPAADKAPAKAPGGGGGGGATHMPNMSHGSSARGLGQATRSSGAPRVNSHAGSSAPNRLTTHSTTGSPTAGKTGPAGAGGQSSNPLLKKGGQAGSNGQGSNPLTRSSRQAGAPNTNPGAKSANPLAKKGASQGAMNGRGAGNLTGKNNARLNGGRALGAQNKRGFNNRAGNFQRGVHANYRVRPYRDVFHNYRAVRHDRGWYTGRYDRVVVVGGGYYYWDAGYWYPAWGYDPAFSFYVYDGPIYSYDNLPPDQVTMNVQTELQDEGYYTGEVDGQVGPKTRDALGAYQADHNLEVTSAIDEPTVEALGLTG